VLAYKTWTVYVNSQIDHAGPLVCEKRELDEGIK